MNNIKIILLCGGPFALPVMRELFFHKRLDSVIVPQDCYAFGRETEQLLHGAVPVLEVTKETLESKLLTLINKNKPALGLVMGFSYKIPATFFSLPHNGFFNIHPGPLPAYRGPDPVFRQIINREEYAAVTIHKLSEKMDAGDIVLQEKIRLSVTDTHGMLTGKLAELATGMVDSLIKLTGYGATIRGRMQDESKAVYFNRQAEKDVVINWQTMGAPEIIARINACNPWNKGAVTKINEMMMKFPDAEIFPVANETPGPGLPGTILRLDKTGMLVATIDKPVLVKVVCCDAGIFSAAMLKNIGVNSGMIFQTL